MFWSSRPILDEETVSWLFDIYAWAQHNLNDLLNPRLIFPSNDYFPGQENSPDAMAALIFSKVSEYAGMNHWPLQLVPLQQMENAPPLQWDGNLNNPDLVLPVPYNPIQLTNPQALIASLAHALAMYQGSQAKELPPGGEENWPHTTEVLAVYMGFGIMFANSAFNVRVTSCGSCQGPSNDRAAYLSQYDITYALAVYSVLNQIHSKQVLHHLKSALHSFFKKAVKDVLQRQELQQLQRDATAQELLQRT
ncbi:MAG: hypothetical protein OEZ68_20615 [Gammaproteobacteria bacterium]|nr:hypothetical protein [Gammaproteobacteria bacterium]MDH5803208.1 hypothetical protein [Gammaproteobacteria bacterium]